MTGVQTCALPICDDNVEWFQEWDYDVYPSDTINIGYDPDTECDCDVDIEVYVDIFDNQTGDYVDSLYDDHTIYNGEEDWFVQGWTADYEGTYDFNVSLYDEDWNLEDWFEINNVTLPEVEQNAAPVIDALNVANGNEGEEISLSADAHDDDNDTLTYDWDFGDGETASGENVKHTWADDGDYTVTVIVSDGEADVSESATVSVANRAPTLTLSVSATSGDEGDSFAFSAATSDVTDDTVSVTWDFGDGGSATGLAVTHTFTDDGTFVVEVIASDEDGGVTSEKLFITIANVAPTLTNLQLPSSVKQGEPVTVSIEATDPGDDEVTIIWNWGDGTTDEGGTVTHTYDKVGTYTVTVCATDDDGGEDCQQATIPIELLQQAEDDGGLLPGFGLLSALAMLGLLAIFRRR